MLSIKGATPPADEPEDHLPEVAQEPKSSGVGEASKILAELVKHQGVKRWHKGSEIPLVQRIPTGLFEFDLATGGGIPMHRLTIIYGPESSGKSNLCYLIAKAVQNCGTGANKVVWVDLEGTFDPSWVGRFGVNLEELIVLKPGHGEQAVDMIDALVRANDVGLVIVDSIAVLSAARELEKSTETQDVGTAPMLVKRLCNRLAFAFSDEAPRGHFPTVVFINQRRFKAGMVMGDPETMPGGETMKFLSSLTIRLSSSAKVDKTVNPDLPVVRETTARIKKSKVGVRQAQFTYDMAVVNHGNLGPGDTDSFKTVLSHLKDLGKIEKVPTGWKLMGKVYPTLVPIQDTYYAEPEFAAKLQKLVLDAAPKATLVVSGE